MDKFIQVGALTWLREEISGSHNDDDIGIRIRRDSDGYWWNFTTLAFQVSEPSPIATMDYDAYDVWKKSFTPGTAGTYSVWIVYGESSIYHQLEAVGTPAPAAYGGTGLVTEAELESFLETSLDSTLAATLINSATAFLESACGRTFRSAAYTNEYLSGDGTPYLYLNNYPVSAITSLTLFDRYSAADVQTLTEDRDFYLDPDSGRLVCSTGVFVAGRRNYRCTYTGGYAAIPEDIKVLCMQLIGYWISKKGNAGIDSQTIGKYSVTYSKDALPVEIQAGIQRLTRVVF